MGNREVFSYADKTKIFGIIGILFVALLVFLVSASAYTPESYDPSTNTYTYSVGMFGKSTVQITDDSNLFASDTYDPTTQCITATNNSISWDTIGLTQDQVETAIATSDNSLIDTFTSYGVIPAIDQGISDISLQADLIGTALTTPLTYSELNTLTTDGIPVRDYRLPEGNQTVEYWSNFSEPFNYCLDVTKPGVVHFGMSSSIFNITTFTSGTCNHCFIDPVYGVEESSNTTYPNQSNLLASYNFELPNRTIDNTGNGNDLVVTPAVAYTFGYINKTVVGTSSSNKPNSVSNGLTYCFLFKAPDSGVLTPNANLFMITNSSVPQSINSFTSTIQLGPGAGSGVNMKVSTSTQQVTLVSVGNVSDGKWHNLCNSLNITNSSFTGYFDSQDINQSAVFTGTIDPISNGIITGGTGYFDKMFFWNRTMDGVNIQNIMSYPFFFNTSLELSNLTLNSQSRTSGNFHKWYNSSVACSQNASVNENCSYYYRLSTDNATWDNWNGPYPVNGSKISLQVNNTEIYLQQMVSFHSGVGNVTPRLTSIALESNYAPTQGAPFINSTLGTNTTKENITAFNVSTADLDNDSVKNLYVWNGNASKQTLLYMPFEGGSNSSYTKNYANTTLTGPVSKLTWNSTGGYDGLGAYMGTHTVTEGINVTKNNYRDSPFYGMTQFTACLWVKPDVNDSLEPQFAIASINYYGGSGAGGWALLKYGTLGINSKSTQNFRPLFALNNGSRFTGLGKDVTVPVGSWQHFCLRENNTRVSYWNNGTEVASLLYDGNNVNNSWNESDMNICIGANGLNCGSGNHDSWNGSIDEVYIYNYARSDQQILNDYKNNTNKILSQELSVGDTWNVSITPNDNQTDGVTQSATILIDATPTTPTINSPLNNSRTIGNSQVLNCSGSTDADAGDTVYYDFFADNLTNPPTTLIQNLTNTTATFSTTDGLTYNWFCKAHDNRTTSSKSNTFTFLENTAPIANNFFLNTSDVNNATNGTVNLSVGFTDNEKDSIIFHVWWWLNNLFKSVWNDLTSINAGNTTRGDNFTAIVSYNDTYENGTNLTATVIIADTAPTQGAPFINSTLGANTTKENITAFNVSTFDADNDPVQNIFEKYNYEVVNLQFEGGSNSTWTRNYANSSSSDNSVTIIGGLWNSTGGENNLGAYTFDGFSGKGMYVNGTLASTNLSFETNFTLETRLKINFVNDTTARYFITGKNQQYIMYYLANNTGQNLTSQEGYVYCSIYTSNGTQLTVNTPLLQSGAWHTWDCVYNQTQLSLWQDNAEVPYIPHPRYNQGQLLNTSSLLPSHNSPLCIANIPQRTTGNCLAFAEAFNGTIDRVDIMNRALSPEQIQMDYFNMTSTVSHNELMPLDNWTIGITPNDGLTDGVTQSASIFIINETFDIAGISPAIGTTIEGQNALNFTFNLSNTFPSVKPTWCQINVGGLFSGTTNTPQIGTNSFYFNVLQKGHYDWYATCNTSDGTQTVSSIFALTIGDTNNGGFSSGGNIPENTGIVENTTTSQLENTTAMNATTNNQTTPKYGVTYLPGNIKRAILSYYFFFFLILASLIAYLSFDKKKKKIIFARVVNNSFIAFIVLLIFSLYPPFVYSLFSTIGSLFTKNPSLQWVYGVTMIIVAFIIFKISIFVPRKIRGQQKVV